MNEQKDQKNKEIRDALFPDCPIRNVLARVGDKWSLLVLYNLQHREPVRFKELQRQIPDISQKSLTQTLRTLEEDGFVSREVFPEVPPRVEYSLTPRALSFLPLVENMINWAKENMEEINKDRTNNITITINGTIVLIEHNALLIAYGCCDVRYVFEVVKGLFHNCLFCP